MHGDRSGTSAHLELLVVREDGLGELGQHVAGAAGRERVRERRRARA